MNAERRARRGAVLVQVVVVMTLLIAFTALTTDYGLMAMRKRQLQNGADAAALAGAQDVGASAASRELAAETARMYAAENNVPVERVTAEGPTAAQGGKLAQPARVTVVARDTVRSAFAQIMGKKFRFGTVRARAVAAAYPQNRLYRLRPWALPIRYFDPKSAGAYGVSIGEQVTLHLSKEGVRNPYDLGPGNFYTVPVALDKQPDPANESTDRYPKYETYIRSGYPEPVQYDGRFSVSFISQPGSLDSIIRATGTAVNGSEGLLNGVSSGPYASENYENATFNNPRVVFLPIVDEFYSDVAPEGGEYLYGRVINFATFYIEGLEGNRLTGRFINWSMPWDGEMPSKLNPQDYTDGMPRKIRLIE